jgi:hypothetical protein
MKYVAAKKIGEVWRINDKQTLTNVHTLQACKGPCPLHHPSRHSMRKFSLLWREDAFIFERVCSHGIGHPDPDTLVHLDRLGVGEGYGVHGCDGCCEGAYSESIQG